MCTFYSKMYILEKNWQQKHLSGCELRLALFANPEKAATYLIKSDCVFMRSAKDRSPTQTVWISIIIWCKCSPCEKWRDLCICTLDESARVQVSFIKPIRMNGFVSADEFSTCNPSMLAPKSLYALCVSWVRIVDTVCPPVRSKFVMENARQRARGYSNVPEGELSARFPR